MTITLHELNMCCPIVAAMDLSLKKTTGKSKCIFSGVREYLDEITISYSAIKYV